jgi:hypothetical protein
MKTTFAVALTLAVVTSVSENGIWTGHDWQDTTNGVQDVNGVVSGLSADMIRRMESASIYAGADLAEKYLDQPNVQMVQSVLS